MSFAWYPDYKKSGVEWLGDVPAHWNVAPIGGRFWLRSGYPFSAELFSSEGESNNRIIRIRDILKNDSEFYTSEECPEWAKILDGDVIVGMDGDFNVAFWKGGVAKLNQRVCALRGKARDWDRYLYYGIPTPLKVINDLTFSTTVKHLSSSQVLKTRFPFPSEDEVKSIVAFLDHETARIDALIAEQQRLIKLLKEKRQAVISHAITRGLDPTVPMKDSGVEWLGEVPAHWAVGALRCYSRIQGGLAKGKSNDGRNVVELPYLRVANVQDGHVDLSDLREIEIATEEVERYLLQDGDVLMNEGGDNDKLGRGTVWRAEVDPCLHQNHVFAIRTDRRLLPEWLAVFTGSTSARAYFYLFSKQSTNLASISSSNVMGCYVPIPPLEEQHSIIQYVSKVSSGIDRLVNTAYEAIALLSERRSALISAAVTGKIDVRNWQPGQSSTTNDYLQAAEKPASYA